MKKQQNAPVRELVALRASGDNSVTPPIINAAFFFFFFNHTPALPEKHGADVKLLQTF